MLLSMRNRHFEFILSTEICLVLGHLDLNKFVSGILLVLVHGPCQDVLYFSVSKSDFFPEFGYICSELAGLQIFTVFISIC
jgi:hypothetical protein